MKEIVIKSLLKDLRKSINILEKKEAKDLEELKQLSDHTIEDVALYKNLDAVSLAVLIYSIYKTHHCISDENYSLLLKTLRTTAEKLDQRNLGGYNQGLKKAFSIVKKCNASIKTHVQDVFYAAKIKKGYSLMEHGLSIARAAQVMGISRWELTEYTGKRNILNEEHEKIHVITRMQNTFSLFENQNKNQPNMLFFDAGPLITLTLSRLLWILEPLKRIFGGTFYITNAVYNEVITKPGSIKRFAYESLEIQKLITDGVLTMYSKTPKTKVDNLTKNSNMLYSASGGKWLEIIQAGEMETVVASQKEGSKTIVMDERTMRLLIEDCSSLKSLLERRSRKKVEAHNEKIDQFTKSVGNIPIVRSIELAGAAFAFGLLDIFLPNTKFARDQLLDAVLWNTKYNGCAVTEHELEELKVFLLQRKTTKKV
jgi:hypothetical protein